MTPDQARIVFEFLLPKLESEQTVTRSRRKREAIGPTRPVVEIWFVDAVIHRRFGEISPLPEAVSTCQDVAGLILFRHSVHHRGQLSAYVRPMGARVPAIYVESADEPFPGDDGGTLAADRRPPAF